MARDGGDALGIKPAVFEKYDSAAFTDRERLALELDSRRPFPLQKAARISHMVRFFPSLADQFRSALVARRVGEMASLDERRRVIAKEISDLGRFADDQKKISEHARNLLDLNEQIASHAPPHYPGLAHGEFDKLKALFGEDGPLDAEDGKGVFHPSGQKQRCWLSFPTKAVGTEHVLASDFRLFWEVYEGNQNLTAFEEFTFEPRRQSIAPLAKDGRIDTSATALQQVLDYLPEIPGDEPFGWVGDMLALTHIYLVPARDALATALGDDDGAARVISILRRHFLKEPLDEPPEQLEELRKALFRVAKTYFSVDAPNLEAEDSLSCAITRLADGRALLIADRVHRAEDGDGTAARRAIIFDIAMSPEERGRIVKALCDIASYQTLAQRDYPYAQAVFEVLGMIMTELNTISAEFGRLSDELLETHGDLPASLETARHLDVALNRLHRLTSTLSATDLFVKGGIRTAAKNARTFGNLHRQRIDAMQPKSFSACRGLESVAAPLDSVVGVFEEVAERYEHCERRLNELTSLMTATLDRIHARQIEELTKDNIKLGEKSLKTAEESRRTSERSLGVARLGAIGAILSAIGAIAAVILNLTTGERESSLAPTDPAPSQASSGEDAAPPPPATEPPR